MSNDLALAHSIQLEKLERKVKKIEEWILEKGGLIK